MSSNNTTKHPIVLSMACMVFMAVGTCIVGWCVGRWFPDHHSNEALVVRSIGASLDSGDDEASENYLPAVPDISPMAPASHRPIFPRIQLPNDDKKSTDASSRFGGLAVVTMEPAETGYDFVQEKKGDGPTKQPPPIVDFDPPNPKKDKEKLIPGGPIVPSAPTSGTAVPVGPRLLLPFRPQQVRLPLLGDPTVKAQGTLVPSKETEENLNKYVRGLADPMVNLDLIQGRARILVLKSAPKRIQVAAESVVTCTICGGAEVAIVGNQVGATVMNIWVASGDDKNKDVLLSYLVRVAPDPDSKQRMERAYQALEGEINQTFSGCSVQLRLVGDAMVVLGRAGSRVEADSIVRVVAANMPGSDGKTKVINLLVAPEKSTANPAVEAARKDCKHLDAEINRVFPESKIEMAILGEAILVTGQVPHRTQASEILRVIAANAAPRRKIIDQLQCYGGEQIRLKVLIAEVKRGSGQRGRGSFDFTQQTRCLDRARAIAEMNHLRGEQHARVLSEPTLLTLDGKTARIESGGHVVGATGPTATPVPYGVQMVFTPTILSRNRIRLDVAASVGARDPIGQKAMPFLVNSRGFSSTVEMREGETLAVAGLMQTTNGSGRVRFLFWRDQTEDQELVILITPEVLSAATPSPPTETPNIEITNDHSLFSKTKR